MDNNEMITLKQISKIYSAANGNVPALLDVNYSISMGQFTAVMGRSGSGKSTLLNILGTMIRPTQGEYYFKGKRVDQMSENQILELRRKEIGFVFQRYRLLRPYTIWENICMPLALDGARVDEKYIGNLVEQCGISDKLDDYPDQLSGGQQQRVALVRGMAHKPTLLLADEPTGNLDYRTGMDIMKLIMECKREFGQTIVMVTHDNECASFADQIVVLEDGRIRG